MPRTRIAKPVLYRLATRPPGISPKFSGINFGIRFGTDHKMWELAGDLLRQNHKCGELEFLTFFFPQRGRSRLSVFSRLISKNLKTDLRSRLRLDSRLCPASPLNLRFWPSNPFFEYRGSPRLLGEAWFGFVTGAPDKPGLPDKPLLACWGS